jgi:hypothetical protein
MKKLTPCGTGLIMNVASLPCIGEERIMHRGKKI